MAIASKNIIVSKAGASTAMVDEAMSNTTGNTYQIDDTAKRIFDPNIALTFEDNGSPIASSDITNIDYLFGKVTFATSKTEPVTVATGSYLPQEITTGISTFTLTMSKAIQEITTLDTPSVDSDYKRKLATLKDLSFTLDALIDPNDYFLDLLDTDTPILFNIDMTSNFLIRFYALFENDSIQTSEVDGVLQSSLSFSGTSFQSVDDFGVFLSFDIS